MSCLRIGSTGAFPWQCRAFADSLSRSPDLSPGLVPVSFVYCLRRPVTSEWVVWSPWSRLPGRLGLESRPWVSVSVFRPRVSVAGLRFRLSAPSRRFRVRTRVLVTCFRFRVSVPVSRLRAVAPVCGPGSWSRVSVSESPFPSLGCEFRSRVSVSVFRPRLSAACHRSRLSAPGCRVTLPDGSWPCRGR